jgi:hypothetical protein
MWTALWRFLTSALSRGIWSLQWASGVSSFAFLATTTSFTISITNTIIIFFVNVQDKDLSALLGFFTLALGADNGYTNKFATSDSR